LSVRAWLIVSLRAATTNRIGVREWRSTERASANRRPLKPAVSAAFQLATFFPRPPQRRRSRFRGQSAQVVPRWHDDV